MTHINFSIQHHPAFSGKVLKRVYDHYGDDGTIFQIVRTHVANNSNRYADCILPSATVEINV